jgi:hypothetical protein
MTKKWSSFGKQQMITESWRRFLSEERSFTRPSPSEPLSGEPTTDAVKAFVAGHDKGLEEFVTMLKQIASDPEFRKLAFAGQKDAAGPSDEALTVSKGTPVPANQLTPTQKDIDFQKSFGDQMINKYKATTYALEDPVTMASPGGRIPLLTYKNKFILDGHHRWSQVMMTNPGASMTVSNLSGDALPNAEVALKATQLAIAALAGNVETKDTDKNLLSVDEEYVKNYVRKNVTQEVLELMVQAGKITRPDAEEAATYYAGNLAAIKAKPAGAFGRDKGMPQADESGVAQARVNKALELGQINFDDPKPSDVKSGNK